MKKVLAALILFGPPAVLITYFVLKVPATLILFFLLVALVTPLILLAVYWALNQFGW